MYPTLVYQARPFLPFWRLYHAREEWSHLNGPQYRQENRKTIQVHITVFYTLIMIRSSPVFFDHCVHSTQPLPQVYLLSHCMYIASVEKVVTCMTYAYIVCNSLDAHGIARTRPAICSAALIWSSQTKCPVQYHSRMINFKLAWNSMLIFGWSWLGHTHCIVTTSVIWIIPHHTDHRMHISLLNFRSVLYTESSESWKGGPGD